MNIKIYVKPIKFLKIIKKFKKLYILLVFKKNCSTVAKNFFMIFINILKCISLEI